MSKEILCPTCPRCGLVTEVAEGITAERMPDVDGTRRYELIGHVYYHPSGMHCAIPKVGEAYTICPPKVCVTTPATGTADALVLGRGTGDNK